MGGGGGGMGREGPGGGKLDRCIMYQVHTSIQYVCNVECTCVFGSCFVIAHETRRLNPKKKLLHTK